MINPSEFEINTVQNSSIKSSANELGEIIKNFPTTPIYTDFELSEQLEKLISREVFYHTVRLHHVLKLEDKKHKIPFKLKTRRLFEKDGDYLHKIFNLCIAIHGRQNELKYQIPYNNAFEWFYMINVELLNVALQGIITPFEFKDRVHNGEKKRYLLREFNQYVSELKVLDKTRFTDENLTTPYILMIRTGIDLASRMSYFKNSYWTPYIKSMRELSKDTESSLWQLISLDDNGVVKRQNKGRSKTVA